MTDFSPPLSARLKQAAPLAGLLVAYFLFRLPHLRDQVIFCDEATYLRWAQLVAQDPLHNLFISMEDAKLPLHYWLLALARPMASDPVYAGRLLSVLFGALTLPAIFGLCGELTRLLGASRPLAMLAAGLTIVCPLVAMNQRMALAEPLLLLESVLLAWQSLRLARQLHQNAPARVQTRQAIPLGVLWGLLLLTKQNFSYALWALPPAAWLLTLAPGTWRTQARQFLSHYAVATIIGLGMFVPVVLLTSQRFNLSTRLFYKPELVSSDPQLSRGQMILHNLQNLFVPRAGGQLQLWPYDAAAPLDSGTLYLYLTPPILLLAFAGAIAMAARKNWRLLGFCALWCAALLGTLVFGTSIPYSRYLLLGTFPLLILAADGIATLLQPAFLRAHRLAAIGLCGAIVIWPALATGRAGLDARAPVLTASDRNQYVTGYPAGNSAQQVVAWLQDTARRQPITVVTGIGLGLRNDYTWLMLDGRPDIQLYCDDSMPPLRKAPDGMAFLASRRQWNWKMEPVVLPPNRPVYYLADCSNDSKPGETNVMPLRFFGPGASLVRIFENPPSATNQPLAGNVIYQIQRPSPAPPALAAP